VTLWSWRRIRLALGAVALVGTLLLTYSAGSWAQTPGAGLKTTEPGATATLEPTPGPEVKTVLKVTVDPTVKQPIKKGTEFEAQISIDDVEHLAGFSVAISYDPKRLEPVLVERGSQNATAQEGTPTGGSGKVAKSANLGDFLKSSGRQEILCSDAMVVRNTVAVGCNLLGPPVCAGGAPGVSGSGAVASVYFKSKGGGETQLKIAQSGLAADDIDAPCDVSQDFNVKAIRHRRLDATIQLAKDSSNTALIIGIVAAVVAVVVVGGGAGYYFYRQRASQGS
jgi:hypothetical protein